MIPYTLVELGCWLIAGAMASWLFVVAWNPGPLGLLGDWIIGPAGSLLGGLLCALILGQPLDSLAWWFSIPAAYAGALGASALLRFAGRARRSA